MKEKTTLTGAAALDLLTMARTWPDLEWRSPTSAEVWAYGGGEIHGLHGTQVERVGTGQDIYDLLDDTFHLLSGVSDLSGFALVTWGWAAPVNPATGDLDGAPSESPARRRVRLCVYVSNAGVYSRLAFEDSTEDVDDNGEATGPLAEACAEVWAMLNS